MFAEYTSFSSIVKIELRVTWRGVKPHIKDHCNTFRDRMECVCVARLTSDSSNTNERASPIIYTVSDSNGQFGLHHSKTFSVELIWQVQHDGPAHDTLRSHEGKLKSVQIKRFVINVPSAVTRRSKMSIATTDGLNGFGYFLQFAAVTLNHE